MTKTLTIPRDLWAASWKWTATRQIIVLGLLTVNLSDFTSTKRNDFSWAAASYFIK